VIVDRDRAIQVLNNLLTTAMRYTPAPGRVEIRARRADDRVIIEVADSGIGLSPPDLARVFERFYRVDRSRSRAGGGSGVGLTIARALAEAMSGGLTAASAGPGKGSTFTVWFPWTSPA
jgi:signal transduction histidine kinase